ncbi:MAG: hypothetical protein K1X57_10365 [Gemmataceae bacterium]|nr:hypothetical protein [Gemmataceae bacterium]
MARRNRLSRPSAMLLDDRIVPAVMSWTGGPLGLGTNWFDAGNWDIVGTVPVQHAVPGLGDDAILSAENPGGPSTVFVNGAAGVRSLNLVRNLSITGSFTMGGGLFNYGHYQLNGGTLDILNGSSLQNLTITGSDTQTIEAGRTVSLYATSISLPLTNYGTVVSPFIDSISGFTIKSTMTNAPSGTVWMQGGTALIEGKFTNQGLLRLEATAGVGPTHEISFGMSSDSSNAAGATILAQPGTGGRRKLDIRSDATFTNSGAIQTSGIDLSIASGSLNPTFVNTGALNIGTGTTLVNGYFMNIDYQGGPVSGGGTWDWSGQSTKVKLTANLTNANFDIKLNSGTIINGPATLTNAAGRTISGPAPTLNAPVVNQAGAIWQVLAGPTQVNGTFTNSGTIELTSVVNSDSTLDLHSLLTNLPGGVVRSLAGAGGNRTIRLFDGTTFDNQGTLSVDTVNLSITSGNSPAPTFKTSGTLSISPGRTLSTGYFMNVDYGGGTTTGGGTWSVGSSFTTLTLNANLTVSGIVLSLVSGLTANGTGQLVIAAGGIVSTTGTTLNVPVVNSGTFLQTQGYTKCGAFTNLAGATLSLQHKLNSGVDTEVNGTISNSGTITFSGPSAGAPGYTNLHLYGGFVNLPGGVVTTSASATGAEIRSYSGTGFDNQGLITLAGANFRFRNFGAPAFQNSGRITVPAGNTFTCEAPIVNSGTGQITGAGSVVGAVSGTGTLSPGASPGLLTVTGNVSLGGLAVELNGTTAGSQYDQLVVNGTVTLSGPLTRGLGFPAKVGDVFRIIDNDGSDTITGTFTGLAEGATVSFLGGATAGISYKGGTGNDVTLTMLTVPTLTAPKITGIQVNDGSAQRSRVTSVTVNFDSLVNVPFDPASAFTLVRQSDGLPVALQAVYNQGTTTKATLTFTGGAVDAGSLADGRYTLTALASQLNNPGGSLDGDANGIAGDDYTLVGNTTNKLFRLYGDADGSGQVDSSDFLAFRLAFLSASPAFDADGSGQVDSSDFLRFRLNFLKTV